MPHSPPPERLWVCDELPELLEDQDHIILKLGGELEAWVDHVVHELP